MKVNIVKLRRVQLISCAILLVVYTGFFIAELCLGEDTIQSNETLYAVFKIVDWVYFVILILIIIITGVMYKKGNN